MYYSDIIGLLRKSYPEKMPSIVLMGHSLGGAIAVNVAATAEADLPIIGLVVIDVVEGSAMESLASMQSFLRSRPKSFKSLKDAISWGYVESLAFHSIINMFIYLRILITWLFSVAIIFLNIVDIVNKIFDIYIFFIFKYLIKLLIHLYEKFKYLYIYMFNYIKFALKIKTIENLR